jgi:hypothetical protein
MGGGRGAAVGVGEGHGGAVPDDDAANDISVAPGCRTTVFQAV